MIAALVLLYINLNIVSPTWSLHLTTQSKAVDKAETGVFRTCKPMQFSSRN